MRDLAEEGDAAPAAAPPRRSFFRRIFNRLRPRQRDNEQFGDIVSLAGRRRPTPSATQINQATERYAWYRNRSSNGQQPQQQHDLPPSYNTAVFGRRNQQHADTADANDENSDSSSSATDDSSSSSSSSSSISSMSSGDEGEDEASGSSDRSAAGEITSDSENGRDQISPDAYHDMAFNSLVDVLVSKVAYNTVESVFEELLNSTCKKTTLADLDIFPADSSDNNSYDSIEPLSSPAMSPIVKFQHKPSYQTPQHKNRYSIYGDDDQQEPEFLSAIISSTTTATDNVIVFDTPLSKEQDEKFAQSPLRMVELVAQHCADNSEHMKMMISAATSPLPYSTSDETFGAADATVFLSACDATVVADDDDADDQIAAAGEEGAAAADSSAWSWMTKTPPPNTPPATPPPTPATPENECKKEVKKESEDEEKENQDPEAAAAQPAQVPSKKKERNEWGLIN
ncbi:Oidioi.mRNA.OKI2018_I69.PAR.g9796.t1.cds [Oikopleura dioica]|uniref:Oidioi.mRNA.OKI2018_I69.PAR.g9796.t1.cds n=1 Tax=Oikopleura dioica TaxID=34765 RepID=A0ABN7RQY8_OIKDI|nr:Oidioi.mRNA.OKI2018_I69.PAR.g9796.t1.cds [Oikopleura dioica]